MLFDGIYVINVKMQIHQVSSSLEFTIFKISAGWSGHDEVMRGDRSLTHATCHGQYLSVWLLFLLFLFFVFCFLFFVLLFKLLCSSWKYYDDMIFYGISGLFMHVIFPMLALSHKI